MIVVNKADTVSAAELEDVLARVKAINGLAKVHVTRYSQVPALESFLLDLHAYDGVKALEGVQRKGHNHLDPVRPLLFDPHFRAPEKHLDNLQRKKKAALKV